LAKRWYIVHTYSGFEERVMQGLTQRIDALGYRELFGEIKIPKETVVELKSGKKKEAERKIFPGYILVEIETETDTDGSAKMPDDAWHLVRQTPKVTGFVGGVKRPTPLSEEEVSQILHHVEVTKEKPKPKDIYETGDLVRISDGPFQNFTGRIEDVNLERGFLKVSVTIFGRSTPVELTFFQVQKL
jgi:transcriptional antiterminator NusG